MNDDFVVNLKQNITMEDYALAVKTGIDFCFDENGEYIPYMRKFAKNYAVLLCLSEMDVTNKDKESLFQFIFRGQGVQYTASDFDILNDVWNDIEEGIKYRKSKAVHASELDKVITTLSTVLNLEDIVPLLKNEMNKNE